MPNPDSSVILRRDICAAFADACCVHDPGLIAPCRQVPPRAFTDRRRAPELGESRSAQPDARAAALRGSSSWQQEFVNSAGHAIRIYGGLDGRVRAMCGIPEESISEQAACPVSLCRRLRQLCLPGPAGREARGRPRPPHRRGGGACGDNRYEAGHTAGLRLLRVAARTRAEHGRDAAGRLYAAGAWNPARSAPRRTGTPAAGGPRNSAPAR
jgi:hypothetical protein